MENFAAHKLRMWTVGKPIPKFPTSPHGSFKALLTRYACPVFDI
jgi:hypothetical protein